MAQPSDIANRWKRGDDLSDAKRSLIIKILDKWFWKWFAISLLFVVSFTGFSIFLIFLHHDILYISIAIACAIYFIAGLIYHKYFMHKMQNNEFMWCLGIVTGVHLGSRTIPSKLFVDIDDQQHIRCNFHQPIRTYKFTREVVLVRYSIKNWRERPVAYELIPDEN